MNNVKVVMIYRPFRSEARVFVNGSLYSPDPDVARYLITRCRIINHGMHIYRNRVAIIFDLSCEDDVLDEVRG